MTIPFISAACCIFLSILQFSRLARTEMAEVPIFPGQNDHCRLDVRFEKELRTDNNNVFTSCASDGEILQCYNRVNNEAHEMQYVLDRLFYSKDFELLKTERNFVVGEDPRVLNSTHTFDNKGFMIIATGNKVERYGIAFDGNTAGWPSGVNKKGNENFGKNYIWFVFDDHLYVIKWLSPLWLLRCCDHCHMSTGILGCSTVVRENHSGDRHYRGGTVGYQLGNFGVFGIGHKTTRHPLVHQPFAWFLNMSSDVPEIVNDLNKSMLIFPDSLKITDPTSMLFHNNGKIFIITTESNYHWYMKRQVYLHKIYSVNRSRGEILRQCLLFADSGHSTSMVN